MIPNKKILALLFVALALPSCTHTKTTKENKTTKTTRSHKTTKPTFLKPASAAPRLSELQYRSSSVLLFYTDRHGTQKAILADEAHGWDSTTYCDFGGKRERGEVHPVQTAAHEFYEEAIIPATLGWTLEDTRNFIDIAKSRNTQQINVYSNKKICHVSFLTDFTQYRDQFFKKFPIARKNAKDHRFREKNKLAIVTWQDLKDAVTQQRKSWFTRNQAVSLFALVQNPRTGRFNKEIIALRPSFVMSLRPFFLNRAYIQGQNQKIRFYND